MKNKRYTLSIGVPAYNEEANIGHLLNALLNQKQTLTTLKEIIVVSDASTDNTAKIVRSFKDSRIRLIENKYRKGGRLSQNEIIRVATGETLVLLDADTLPARENLIEEISMPIIQDRTIGLTGADIISLKPKGFLERIISDSHDFKWLIFKKLRKGDNIYLCQGRARAFSKDLYKKINWPADCPEDAYSYLFCLKKGLKFKFVPNAKVLFRSPTNFDDYATQSNRFRNGKSRLEEYFSSDEVKMHFNIPLSQLLFGLFLVTLKRPLTTILYLMISFFAMTLKSKYKYSYKWEISKSSKQLVFEK